MSPTCRVEGRDRGGRRSSFCPPLIFQTLPIPAHSKMPRRASFISSLAQEIRNCTTLAWIFCGKKTYWLMILICVPGGNVGGIQGILQYTDYLTAPETPCSNSPGYNFKDCVDRAVGKNISLLHIIYARKQPSAYNTDASFIFTFYNAVTIPSLLSYTTLVIHSPTFNSSAPSPVYDLTTVSSVYFSSFTSKDSCLHPLIFFDIKQPKLLFLFGSIHPLYLLYSLRRLIPFHSFTRYLYRAKISSLFNGTLAKDGHLCSLKVVERAKFSEPLNLGLLRVIILATHFI
jgi:hypothetical protein